MQYGSLKVALTVNREYRIDGKKQQIQIVVSKLFHVK